MNRIKIFIFALCALMFSVSASAATVSIVQGQSVGKNDFGYFAGIIKILVDGKEMLAMNDFIGHSTNSPEWYTNTETWNANFYTYDDVIGGAEVLFSPEHYSEVAPIFLAAMLGYNPPDDLYAAAGNEWVWDVMLNGLVFDYGWMRYSNMEYSPNTQLITVYQSMLPNINPNYNYSDFMGILINPLDGDSELLVFSGTLTTPVPPAVWLFGSGLLGLVMVARGKSARK